MENVDMASHTVVCQKSYFHRNSDFQNSQKLDPSLIQANKISGPNILVFFRDILVLIIDSWFITKVEIRYNYAIWFV
jgi:hypothetical protein